MGIGTGVSILVSQCAGSGDHERARAIVGTSVSFQYLCSLPLMLLGLLLSPAILRVMAVPEDTMAAACNYLQILMLGVMADLGYNTNAGILRGLGDSGATLLFLGLACIVNVSLDLLFIAVLGMGVAGAAAATVIAKLISWAFSIVYIRRTCPGLGFPVLPRRIDPAVLKQIVRLGLPLGLNTSLYSFGHLVCQTLINSQGAVFMAACSVACRVNDMANITITSLASAMTSFAGQNLGAGRYDRLARGGWQLPAFSGLLTLVLGCLVSAGCEPILRAFTSDPEVIPLAVRYVRIVLPFFWTYTVFNAIMSFVNGLGSVRYTTIVNLLLLWAVRIPLAWAITTYIDGEYLMVAYPISFAFGMVCMLFFYRSRQWRDIRARAAAGS